MRIEPCRGPHHRLRRHRGLHVRRVVFSGRRRRREGGEVLQHMAPPIIGKSSLLLVFKKSLASSFWINIVSAA
jgi:hypothetical protein